MKKLLLIPIFSTILFGCGPKKYSQYICTPPGYSESCSEKCTKQKEDIKLTFIADKDSKSVLQTTFTNGEQTNTFVRKNCTIFNNENWDCSSEFLDKTYWKALMANGIFIDHLQSISTNQAACAK